MVYGSLSNDSHEQTRRREGRDITVYRSRFKRPILMWQQRARVSSPIPADSYSVFKMADGLHAADPVGDVIEKTLTNIIMDLKTDQGANVLTSDDKVNAYYVSGESAQLFDNLCSRNDRQDHDEGLLLVGCEQDDCRKKRCVDRYDSSESSDR